MNINVSNQCFDRLPKNCQCSKPNLGKDCDLEILPVVPQQEQLKSNKILGKFYTGFCECEPPTTFFRADNGKMSCGNCKEELSL